MKDYLKIAVLVGGASLLAASPVFAQDLNALNPLGGLGLDLDPFHIFTPAQPPASPAAAAPQHRHHHAAAHHHQRHVAARHSSHHVAARHAASKAHVAKS